HPLSLLLRRAPRGRLRSPAGARGSRTARLGAPLQPLRPVLEERGAARLAAPALVLRGAGRPLPASDPVVVNAVADDARGPAPGVAPDPWIGALFGPDVLTGSLALEDADPARLAPAEAALAARFGPRRARAFAAGRLCARPL